MKKFALSSLICLMFLFTTCISSYAEGFGSEGTGRMNRSFGSGSFQKPTLSKETVQNDGESPDIMGSQQELSSRDGGIFQPIIDFFKAIWNFFFGGDGDSEQTQDVSFTSEEQIAIDEYDAKVIELEQAKNDNDSIIEIPQNIKDLEAEVETMAEDLILNFSPEKAAAFIELGGVTKVEAKVLVNTTMRSGTDHDESAHGYAVYDSLSQEGKAGFLDRVKEEGIRVSFLCGGEDTSSMDSFQKAELADGIGATLVLMGNTSDSGSGFHEIGKIVEYMGNRDPQLAQGVLNYIEENSPDMYAYITNS